MSSENLLKHALDNRAKPKTAEDMSCEECSERVLFHMRDKYHDFTIGMIDILRCLEFAAKNGDIPKLPADWAYKTGSAYDVFFDDDALDIVVYDVEK